MLSILHLLFLSHGVFLAFRQLALSQQRMDDRRRKKMNSEYNRSAVSDSRADDDQEEN
jgi:hypothetical protein